MQKSPGKQLTQRYLLGWESPASRIKSLSADRDRQISGTASPAMHVHVCTHTHTNSPAGFQKGSDTVEWPLARHHFQVKGSACTRSSVIVAKSCALHPTIYRRPLFLADPSPAQGWIFHADDSSSCPKHIEVPGPPLLKKSLMKLPVPCPALSSWTVSAEEAELDTTCPIPQMGQEGRHLPAQCSSEPPV